MKRLAIPVNQLIPKVRPSKDVGIAVATLRAWFLQLHVSFFDGVPFDKHAEMESEVLARLEQALKDNIKLGGTLLNMVFINMAAEYAAVARANQGVEATRNAQMYFFCFQHNVKTFKVLLAHLLGRLESRVGDSVTAAGHNPNQPLAHSVILQAVRLYSFWFTCNWSFMQKCMENNSPDVAVAEDVRQLWRLLAHVATAVYEQYELELHGVPPANDCELLVDEEVLTMGFLPVQDRVNDEVWKRHGVMKLVCRVDSTPEEQQYYHLIRLRDLFSRAAIIAHEPVCPSRMTPSSLLY